MAQYPEGKSLHPDPWLSEIAVMHHNGDYIADMIFPTIGVEKSNAEVPTFEKDIMFRDNMRYRERGAIPEQITWTSGLLTLDVRPYSLSNVIPDEDRIDASDPFDMDMVATEMLANQAYMQRERSWVENLFKAGVWSNDVSVTAASGDRWGNANSNPALHLDEQSRTMWRAGGVRPNKLVMGEQAWINLKHNPTLLSRIQYTQRAQLTKELVQSLLVDSGAPGGGLEIMCGYALHRGASQTVFEEVWTGGNALLIYVTDSPSKYTANSGYTFFWETAMNGGMHHIDRLRSDLRKSDIFVIHSYYVQQLMVKDAGLFLTDIGA